MKRSLPIIMVLLIFYSFDLDGQEIKRIPLTPKTNDLSVLFSGEVKKERPPNQSINSILQQYAVASNRKSSSVGISNQDELSNNSILNRGTDNPSARAAFEVLKTQNPTTGLVPKNMRLKELEFMRSQKSKFPTLSPGDQTSSWVNRGPTNVGGRTRGFAIDVTDANVLLGGGVSGGMWRSTDQGVTWSKTTSTTDLQSVSCIAQDTREGETSTWYYGTGEVAGNSASGSGAFYVGDGIFKSTDGGLSWSQLPATVSTNEALFDSDFDIVHEIVVNPVNGNIIAATIGGIYISTDGGDSFSLALQSSGQWADVIISSEGVIYAAFDNAGIFNSTDNGDSWTNLTDAGFALSTGDRIEMALAPSNESILYVLREDGGVWKYDGSVQSWEDRSANIPDFGGVGPGGWNPQGGYNLVISVKPQDENFVIIGATNLYRSTDGFASSANTSWIGGYGQSSFLYENHHPDQHVIAWLPEENALISGNDGGLRLTTDVTATNSGNVDPVAWTPLN
ncbi:MAG: exo-alpha-sialidase, partial [Ekhidna sp.]|nr:exo-alpha-sialidase [Ekhidna sp.]